MHTVTISILLAYWMFLPTHLSVFEPSKAFAIDIVCLLTLVTTALQGDVPTLGVSLRSWWTVSGPWHRTGAMALTALVLEIVLSTALSLVPRTSWTGTLNRGQGTAHILLVVGMLATAWPEIAKGRSISVILAGFALGGVIPASVTIMQSWGYDPVSGTALQLDRPTATFGNAVILGSMLAVSALAACELAVLSAWRMGDATKRPAGDVGSDTCKTRLDDVSQTNPTPSLQVPHQLLSIRAIGIAVGLLMFPGSIALSATDPHYRWVVFPACIASAGIASNVLQGDQCLTQTRRVMIAWIIVAILCLVAVGLSRSRGPIVALGTGTAVRIAVHEFVTGAKRARALCRALGVGLVVVTVAVLFGAIGPIAGLVTRNGNFPERVEAESVVAGQISITLRDSWSTRLDVAARALEAYRTGFLRIDETIASRAGLTVGMQRHDILELILNSPANSYPLEIRRAFGFGPDSQSIILGIDGAGLTFDRAHNAILDVLVTLGIAGLGLMTIAGTSIMSRAWALSFDSVSKADGSGSLLGIWTVIGVSSLTGIDSTGQSVVTWVLAGASVAQISRARKKDHEWSVPDTSTISKHPNSVMRSISYGYLWTIWLVFGVILVAAFSFILVESSNSPLLWGCATFITVTAWACGNQPVRNKRRFVALGSSCIIACLIAFPVFGALSAGSDARLALEHGHKSKGNQTHLERALVNDSGQFAYWFLRER